MRTLPLKLRKNGFTYTQVLRGRRSFIYEQHVHPEITYFEVFNRRICRKRNLLGIRIERKEIFPNDEDFSIWAWSYRTIESAMNKFHELEGTTN